MSDEQVPVADMSAEAIESRIREVDALNKLCASLALAGQKARERGLIK